ncbi:MAG: hypothetical protein WC421_04570 [Elusimicrobiales bacterium]
MIGCDENAILFHYGEMDAAQSAAYRGHLTGCAYCRDRLDILAALGAACHKTRPPAEVYGNIRGAVLGGQTAVQYMFSLLRPAMAAAAVLIALLAFSAARKASSAIVADKWDDDFNAVAVSVSAEAAGMKTGYESDIYDYRTSMLEDFGSRTDQYIGG